MDASFLGKLNTEQLEYLRKVLDADVSGRDELLGQVRALASHREGIISGEENFSSDRLFFFQEDKEEQCLELLKQLVIGDFYCFQRALFISGVNRYRNRLISFDELKSIYEQIYNSEICDYENVPLEVLELFFTKPSNIYDFEAIYNTFNYIKDYIYYCLSQKETVEVADLFLDYDKKRNSAAKQIASIATYLCDIKNGTDLLLSVGSGGLVKATRKSGGELTLYQKNLADAVAFGTSLEKIENGNYEDCKRLLYLPRPAEHKNKSRNGVLL